MGASQRFRAAFEAFAKSRDGGALLVGGVLLLALLMIPVGAAMANYAWREAQWEELRAAGRAAVAAAGPLLEGAEQGVVAPIQERVAAFANALVPGFHVEAEDVAVSYDAARDATGVSITGAYDFDEIWMPWIEDAETVTVVVTARFEQERYEVAVALDISRSMEGTFASGADSGTRTIKLDALKTAMEVAVDALRTAAAAGAGNMMVSVVPFTHLVNVADTCNAGADGHCRAARSVGKERYVRMLAGARDTMALTLADARAARDAGTQGHWVDSFLQYGAGTGLGPLRRQFLPDDLLDDRDWNLRRTDVDIDVSAQIPGLRTWTVDDEDFWNGCLMARWGAYWDPDARPADWRQTRRRNWPAAQAVAPWTPASTGLGRRTPLHLSDAPPVATDPNTLFTAYSWPDARISGDADHLLQGAMQEMLSPNYSFTLYQTRAQMNFVDYQTRADNDWSLSAGVGAGGGINCPRNPITPLTEDPEVLRAAVADLAVLGIRDIYQHAYQPLEGTYLHLGIVWGLRTLSPLWSGVWDIRDDLGDERPVVPCAPGEQTADCQANLVKSILIISDGGVNFGPGEVSRTGFKRYPERNVSWQTDLCRDGEPTYWAATRQQTPAAFNSRFKTPDAPEDWVDADDRLNSNGIEDFADAYLRMAGDTGNSARRTTLINTLTNAVGTAVAPTPWQLFRGRDAGLVDVLVDAGSGFQMSGRPVLIDDRCRAVSMFTPYGRIDDLVYVGDTGPDMTTPPVPVAAAPFSWEDQRASGNDFFNTMNGRLSSWLGAACRLAGQRRVRVNAVYIGPHRNAHHIETLESCVDQAGGTPGVRDTFVTPNANDLAAAMRQIFTHRRNLRFLD